MARKPRHIEPNGYYHVISRSVNEEYIFTEESDFLYFCGLIREAKEKYPIRLFHYVLMNTHFHFVLQTFSKETLSSHLSHLKWHYTQWVKKKYGWKGPLWRERFKSLPVEDETYLQACGHYVEMNPVRAGICPEPADYQFSSYRKYHLGVQDELVDEYERNDGEVKIICTPDGFRSPLSRLIFSKAPAIGSHSFVNKFRNKVRDKFQNKFVNKLQNR
jgi:putative transposase